jgi:Icc-related predicted phosphoesterase
MTEMRIVALSDTHKLHRQINVPQGDVLVFAGDLTMTGDLTAVADFANWLNAFDHDHKLVIGGNHDCCFTDRRRTDAIEMLKDAGATYLEDESVAINGLHFYGSPWTPSFNEWCFQYEENGLADKFEKIPADTDILITHGPAEGTGDFLIDYGHIGSKALAQRLPWIAPELHVYGHVHEPFGKQREGSYNVSVLDADYNAVEDAIVIEVQGDD